MIIETIDASKIQADYYFWKLRKSIIGKTIGIDYICNTIEKFYFNVSLINKKRTIKEKLHGFTKKLYIYLTMDIIDKDKEVLYEYIASENGVGEFPQFLTKQESNEFLNSLYNDYIYFINHSLVFNQEYVQLQRLQYFLNIQIDILNAQMNPFIPNKFIKDLSHIKNLKFILKTIINFSNKDDYLTKREFKKLIKEYQSVFFTSEEEILKNIGKIPKRLKFKKRI